MINKAKVIKEAQKFVQKGQVDKAIAEYIKIVKDNPNDTTTHNLIGDLYLKLNDKDSAINSFRSAADVLNKDGFALKAIALYKKVLNINPDQVDVQMQMGKLNAERGMLGNANENYLAAAAYFTKNGKKDRVLDVYKILCNLNPNNMALAQKLAEMYLTEGMVAEGLGKYIQLAEKKVEEGDIPTARKYLDSAKNKGSERDDYIRVSALINLKEGKIPEAVAKLEKLLDEEHTNISIGMLLSDAYVMSGRYEDAAKVIGKFLNEKPADGELRHRLIDVLIKSGDYGAAWEHYRELIDAHVDKNEFSKAEKLVQEYLTYNADSIDARQVLVDLYSNIGRMDKVSVLHAEMAGIYARTGQNDKAVNIYTKLLETEPDNEEFKAAIDALNTPAEPEATASSEPEATAPAETVAGPKYPEEEGGGIPDIGEDISFDLPSGIEDTDQEPAPQPTDIFGVTDDEPLSFGADDDEPEAERAAGFSSGYESLVGGPDDETFEQPGAGVYDLSDAPDELPPLDLEGMGGLDTPEEPAFDSGTYNLSEETAGDIGDLDIFNTDEQAALEPEGEEIKLVSGSAGLDISDIEGADETAGEQPEEASAPVYEPPSFGSAEEPAELTTYEEPSIFDERMTEIDVYIKYGLYPKATETLGSIEVLHPSNPEIYKRYVEICKADGNIDGYVERALQLVGIYKSRGMDDLAESVLQKAVELAPDDERLSLLAGAGASGETGTAVESAAAGVEESDETEAADEDEYAGVAGIAAGSVGYFEELAEADFYAQQGLVKEASAIYRRLLASDPENDKVRNKYEQLMQSAQAAEDRSREVEEEAAPAAEESFADLEMEAPAPVDEDEMSFADLESETSFADIGDAPAHTEPEPEPEPASPVSNQLDDELDAAFSDMGLDEDEPAAAAVETSDPDAEDADDGFFDLAAELREEIGADIISPQTTHGTFGDENLDAVFQEFKRGVNDQLSNEDFDTHYNLGIAYKEMGMIDDALNEFTQASQDPSRTLDCASMLGLCYIEKGEYDNAIDCFKRGLAVKNRDKEEYLGLKYDMATAYELAGDTDSAYATVSDIFKQDETFRDIKKRMQRFEKSLGQHADQPKPNDDDTSAPKTKKSKVSYL